LASSHSLNFLETQQADQNVNRPQLQLSTGSSQHSSTAEFEMQDLQTYFLNSTNNATLQPHTNRRQKSYLRELDGEENIVEP
jgi:hypothetical protein